MSGIQYDDGGDVVMKLVPQPVYEYVHAPELADWSLDKLVAWKKAREQYESKMKQRCANSGESLQKMMLTVKSTMEPKLLEIVCLYELRKAEDQVTEEELRQLIETRTAQVLNDQVPDLDEFFRENLKIDMKEQDIDARILKYYRDFSTLIDKHGFKQILGVGDPKQERYKNRMKLRCNLLIANLQPRLLRADVERYIKYECPEAKKNDFELFQVIKDKARAQHKYHVLNMEGREKPKRGGEEGPKSKSVPLKKLPAPINNPLLAQGRNEKPSPTCWHCHDKHHLRDCPTATEQDKAAAVQKHSRTRGRVKRVRSVVSHSPNAGEVMINQLVVAPYCADSGSDRNVLPSSLVDELIGLGSDIVLTKLNPPITVETASGTQVQCDNEAVVDIELQTAAGPVHLTKLSCLIMSGTQDEFLLGNDALKSLGIDVDKQLEQLVGRPISDDDDPFATSEEPQETIDSDLAECLDSMVRDAVDNGFDTKHESALRDLVFQYQDVFRTALTGDPPANVEPMRVTLKTGAVPYRAKPRRYAPAQSQFLREYTKQLEEAGFIRRNDKSLWASAAVPVKKAGSKLEFRITNDYRPVNAMTVPIAGATPNLAVVTQHVHGAYGFARFDLKTGFWQLPLDVESQEILSFITEDTVYTPTRVPQGATDSAIHFQQQMQKVFSDMLYVHLLIWIDDLLMHAKSVSEFLKVLDDFLHRLRVANLKLNAKKCCLFRTEMRWCGKLVSGRGVSHDPARISDLISIPPPVNAAELQQFVCAAGWLRDHLIDYARIMQPLQVKLTAALGSKSRSQRLAAGISLTWTPEDQINFDAAKTLLSTAQTLSFPDERVKLCLFTDASTFGWGLIVTQVQTWNPDKSAHEQAHELLICKGGSFSGSEINWSIVEKEAYPIIWASQHLDYLLLRQNGFTIFCDHKNLIYLFAPGAEVKQHVRGKLLRWSLLLASLPYTIEHIEGAHNVWADMVSRWARPHVNVSASIKCKVVTRRQAAVSTPDPSPSGYSVVANSYSGDSSPLATQNPSLLRPRMHNFDFPTESVILAAQQSHRASFPGQWPEHNEELIRFEERVWIPAEATDLLTRICIVAHCGPQGHRGIENMMETIRAVFQVKNLATVCRQFMSKCLLCKHVKGPNIIQRPWGPTFQAIRRNQMLHWDFLSLGRDSGSAQYLLVLKDNLTHYCELIPCDSASSAVSAEAILNWYKRFGPPEILISDMGTHFTANVLSELAERLKIEQEFTVAYSPWINGTIERLNRDVLQVLRVMLMEYELDKTQWEFLVPLVQANLNHSPVESLGGKTPIELFTLLPPANPLMTIVFSDSKGDLREKSVQEWSSNSSDALERMRKSLFEMHKEVVQHKEAKRRRSKNESNATPCNFSSGDFVLWSRIDERLPTNKLLARWVGPFRVIECLPHAFEIEHLLNQRRLLFMDLD